MLSLKSMNHRKEICAIITQHFCFNENESQFSCGEAQTKNHKAIKMAIDKTIKQKYKNKRKKSSA